MKRLMLFVEPSSSQLNIFSQFTLPRLGSFVLAGLVNRSADWTARVFVEGRHLFDLRRWIAENGRPAAVGISTITPTARRGYELADQCGACGIPVVLGGPHVTFLPEEALEHSNLVVRGEGETAMVSLLDLWGDQVPMAADARYSDVPSLSWKDSSGAIHHNPMAVLKSDLDALPYPDFSLAGGTADCVVGGKKTVVVQTSRGCPFNCSFCSVTAMFGKKLRERSVPSVIEELSRYDKRDHFVFFCDDNFTANKRRARELLEAMLARRFRFRWSTQVRADIARDPDLVRLMRRAGAHTLFIGFESVNPESLAEMKKGQDVEDIRASIDVIHKAGLHIHGMFVFGFNSDNDKTIEATIKFIQEMKLTSVQLLILTPLPGSQFYSDMLAQKRITSTNWDLYDAHHVVFRPNAFTPLDLQLAQVRGHSRLYALPRGLKKLISGRWVSAGLSFYAWSINRKWKRRNRDYLRQLALDQNQV